MVTLVIWDSPLTKHLCPEFQTYYIIPGITLLHDTLLVLDKKY